MHSQVFGWKKELSIYYCLSEQASACPGSNYIMALLGKFRHIGPNGTHLCLVFKPMASSVNWMLQPQVDGDSGDASLKRCPTSLRKRIL
jgi:hypothetical protein